MNVFCFYLYLCCVCVRVFKLCTGGPLLVCDYNVCTPLTGEPITKMSKDMSNDTVSGDKCQCHGVTGSVRHLTPTARNLFTLEPDTRVVQHWCCYHHNNTGVSPEILSSKLRESKYWQTVDVEDLHL